MPDVIFQDAPDVEDIARKLIGKYHEHLINAAIKYLKRYGNWVVSKKVRLGNAEKCSGKYKHLTGYDFVITVNGAFFDSMKLTQKEALIDHELCHCGVNDDDEYCIWLHDVEDFSAVVHRHGLWQEDVQKFAETCLEASRQLTLYDIAPERQKAVGE